MFKSIVVGVDSSERSLYAQTLAFYLAHQLHASVLGLHVVDILSFEGPLLNDIAAPADVESYLDAPRIRETLTARGRQLLEDFAVAALREQVGAQTALDFGLVANQICERSKSSDLVVLGHRGAPRTDRTKTGSGLTGKSSRGNRNKEPKPYSQRMSGKRLRHPTTAATIFLHHGIKTPTDLSRRGGRSGPRNRHAAQWPDRRPAHHPSSGRRCRRRP